MPTNKEYNIVLPFFAKVSQANEYKYALSIKKVYCFTEYMDLGDNKVFVKTLCGTMVDIVDLDIMKNMYVN